MERDIFKYADWLAKNAREGVVIENMILEWKLAEQKLKASKAEQPVPTAKAS